MADVVVKQPSQYQHRDDDRCRKDCEYALGIARRGRFGIVGAAFARGLPVHAPDALTAWIDAHAASTVACSLLANVAAAGLPSCLEGSQGLLVELQAEAMPVGQHQLALVDDGRLFVEVHGMYSTVSPLGQAATTCTSISGITWLTTGRLKASAMPATFIHCVMPPTRSRSIITMSMERASRR